MDWTKSRLKENDPLIRELKRQREMVWINPDKTNATEAIAQASLSMADIQDAADRLRRFAPFLAKVFPETAPAGGIIESTLREIPAMRDRLGKDAGVSIPGSLYLKMDSHLPISGSIKARGGIYEVLKTAEDIALASGKLSLSDDYSVLASEEFRKLFGQYSIAVGSTGNLGLSIGIMSAALGFHVTVHVSADAKEWKKKLLRSKGVEVVEYTSDYSAAVAQGRALAEGDLHCHFVDDENSKTLFLGYAVAGFRLREQLDGMGIVVDEDHPLFVYLPCGVGGSPGGAAFGIKEVFGDAAHCFFAEPTASCCMLLGMATGLQNAVSVRDIGLDNRTEADGLAVGRASGFVGNFMKPFLSGCFTVRDEHMMCLLAELADTEGIFLEPSALAGMPGPLFTETDPAMEQYLAANGFDTREKRSRIRHIVWATGGSMVPEEEMQAFIREGKKLY